MNIPKIEEAITLLYQTYIENQYVATQRGIAITAMSEMVKLLGGADVVAKIEAVPYSARVRAQHLFEDAPQRQWVGLTEEEMEEVRKQSVDLFVQEVKTIGKGRNEPIKFGRLVEAKLKEKNT